MKIAVLTSREAEKALNLHAFFKEGDRVKIEVVYTDAPDSEAAARFREEGIEVITLSAEEEERLEALMGQRGVELLVIDGMEDRIPDRFKHAFGDRIVCPSSVGAAPLEVIEKIDRINSGARLHRQTPKRNPDQPPTLEEEWADVLKVEYDSEEAERRAAEQTENIADSALGMQEQTPEGAQQQGPTPIPTPTNPGFVPPLVPPVYGQRVTPNEPVSEPMPDTYLVWSVIITILCCFIPGIVAIIFAASVSSKYYAGDIEGAKRASKNAQIWCIVSIIAGIVWATLYLPLTLLIG